jgi:hypothetical protein
MEILPKQQTLASRPIYFRLLIDLKYLTKAKALAGELTLS